MQWLANLWWVRLPRALRRVAETPALVLTDGLYITSLPTLAALLPPALFLLGLLCGWLHPGFRVVFTESLAVLLMATLVGVLSGHLGALFVAGFAVGDYFLFNPAWMFGEKVFAAFLYRFALIIEYALLSMLAAQIPLATKALVGHLYFVARLGQTAMFASAFVGHVVLTLLLVFLWGQAVPVLIRPVFTWAGGQPREADIVILQRFIWPLLATAALASVVRMACQVWVASSTAASERLAAIEEELAEGDREPLTHRLPRIVRALFTAAWGALLLSGLYEFRVEAALVCGVIFVLQLLRLGVVRAPLGAWPRIAERVPLLLRLAFGVLFMFALGAAVLRLFWLDTFRPTLFLVITGLVVFYLLNPTSPAHEARGEAAA
ncbi:MAG TPA: hypothetical protein VGV59_07130 [Pyrinomonadaceae bacterium]|nr:hypothetical protein [Pyrinomonadaceae bacterium]